VNEDPEPLRCPKGTGRSYADRRRFRSFGVGSLVSLLTMGWAGPVSAAEIPTARSLANLYEPDRVSQVALSPDGVHLAYTVYEQGVLSLVVMDPAQPEAKTVLPIGEDRGMLSESLRVRRTARPAVPFLQWSEAGVLVYVLKNRLPAGLIFSSQPRNELRAVDADGKNDRLLLDSNTYDPTAPLPRFPRVIGFAQGAPDTLMLEATPLGGGWERSSLDLKTLKVRFLKIRPEGGRWIYDQRGEFRLFENERVQRQIPPPPIKVGGPGSGFQSIPAPPNPPVIVPQRWHLSEPEGRGRPQDLDELLGKDRAVTFTHDDTSFGRERAFPLGFGADPEILYYASNTGRDTYGIYALNLRTKKRTAFALEDPRFDLIDFNASKPESALRFDRAHRLAGVSVPGILSRTRWVNPVLARLQRQLDGLFPARGVEIVDWDAAMRRVVALVSGPGDPGRYFLYDDASPNRLTEIIRRVPWLPAEMLNVALPFEFVTPAGVALTGTVTLPRQPRLSRPPLVVLCRDLAWRDSGGFARESQALASAGFVVLEVEYRGLSGYGAAHRDAIKAGFDRVPLEDIRAAIDWLAPRHAFDRRRMALVGDGFGGYLALRALELWPDEFRCAVTFNAPTDLAFWATEEMSSGTTLAPDVAARRLLFGSNKAPLEAISVLDHAASITKPVFIILEEGTRTLPFHGTDLRSRLKKRDDAQVEFAELETDEDRRTPEGAAKTYQLVSDFLIANLYDFSVKIGPTKEIP
jgi:dienelactone hydrolase